MRTSAARRRDGCGGRRPGGAAARDGSGPRAAHQCLACGRHTARPRGHPRGGSAPRHGGARGRRDARPRSGYDRRIAGVGVAGERARAAGLEPAGDDGTYFQFWPMRRAVTSPASRASYDGTRLDLDSRRWWRRRWTRRSMDRSSRSRRARRRTRQLHEARCSSPRCARRPTSQAARSGTTPSSTRSSACSRERVSRSSRPRPSSWSVIPSPTQASSSRHLDASRRVRDRLGRRTRARAKPAGDPRAARTGQRIANASASQRRSSPTASRR